MKKSGPLIKKPESLFGNTNLPPGYTTPITYEVSGKQYLVIAAVVQEAANPVEIKLPFITIKKQVSAARIFIKEFHIKNKTIISLKYFQ